MLCEQQPPEENKQLCTSVLCLLFRQAHLYVSLSFTPSAFSKRAFHMPAGKRWVKIVMHVW